MQLCADNYPPGMYALPPEDNPVGECEICGEPIYPGDQYKRHLDMPICKRVPCRIQYFFKYPDVISSFLEEIEKAVGALEITATDEKIW